jgi:DNA-binding PadR family transcriptional regulator
MKKSKTYRISDEGIRLAAALAKKLGVAETAVVELAIRGLAKEEKIK